MDLRSQSERDLEQQAKTPLEPKYEQLARELCGLVEKDAEARIQEIGKQLYAEGNHKLMVLVFYRVVALGGVTCSPSPYWDGIGKWQY